MASRRSDKLRWGFKTEAETTVRELRAELGVGTVQPLSAFKLATHLEIPVAALSSFGDQDFVRYFRGKGLKEFSAMTVFLTATQRVIVYNDFHALTRQAPDIAHECSHGLLLHPPRPAFAFGGCRDVDDVCEQEAHWLAGVLLIPNDAALWIVREGLTIAEAAEHFGVSKELVTWRVNMSGARTIVQRARTKWRRGS
jgi:hypothetical protein